MKVESSLLRAYLSERQRGMSKAWALTNGETLLNLILVFLFAKGKDWDKYDL